MAGTLYVTVENLESSREKDKRSEAKLVPKTIIQYYPCSIKGSSKTNCYTNNWIVNIAKCLSDTISKLERSQDKSGSTTEDDVQHIALLQGVGGIQASMFT